jgi:hypothetical protein
MSKEIDIQLLNQMAALDGERPFDEIDKDLAFVEARDNVDFAESDVEAVFSVTLEWRQGLRLPESTSAASHRLKALINNYEPAASSEAMDLEPQLKRESISFVDKLKELFSSFRYPAGGVAIASSFAVLLLVNQSEAPTTWDARYAALDHGQITKNYAIESTSDFFTRPEVRIRGGTVGTEDSCAKNGTVECDPGSEAFKRAVLDKGLAESVFEPVLRATEIKGLAAARLPDQGLWFLIRADIDGNRPGKGADSENTAEACRLVEAIFSRSNVPPIEEGGYLLSYCPSNWTDKLKIL